jgi:hypothetical protein
MYYESRHLNVYSLYTGTVPGRSREELSLSRERERGEREGSAKRASVTL